jgi:hypothetical protein
MIRWVAFTLDIGGRLQNSNGERFEHQSEPRVFAGPTNGNGLDCVTSATSAPRNGSDDLGCELHGVEVPPGALRCYALTRRFTKTVGACKLPSSMLKQNPHLVFCQIQLHLVDHPRVIETK